MNDFLYVESPMTALQPIDYDDVKSNIINPVTGKPYKGIILFGCFADLKPTTNNNNRIYDIDMYLKLLKDFREKVHSKKGVYGELEHPDSYAVKYPNVSHKILDVYYDEKEQKVMGYVMILNNTPNGKIAREIVESGGCLAISARAAGKEIPQNDGSKLAQMTLLTTYDLVYHPGFSDAVMEFKELNESIDFQRNMCGIKPYSVMIKTSELKSLNESYQQYLRTDVKEKPTECFFGWYGNKKLNEDVNIVTEDEEDVSQDDLSQRKETKKEVKKLQKNDPANKKKLENELSNSVKQDLSEKDKRKYKKRLQQNQMDTLLKINQDWERIENEPLFDGSAGFVTYGVDVS